MKRHAIALAVVMCLPTVHAQEQSISAIAIDNKLVSDAELITVDTDGALILSARRWSELGVAIEPSDAPVSSATLGVQAEYDSERVMYRLTIPAALRPIQTLGNGRVIDTALGESPRGVMIGYDASVTRTQGDVRVSVAHDLRANLARGTLYSTGQWSPDGYARGLTTWSRDLFHHGVIVQLGDVFTSPRQTALTGPVNLGGVRIGTDRALVSDAMYPVPVLGGVADTRSVAELVANNATLSKQIVQPGPYQFSRVFLPSGLNDLTLVTTDASGREYLTTRRVYTMPSMVRAGRTEWDVTLGRVRQGSTSNTYTTPAIHAQAARGMNDRWTLTGQITATPEHRNIALGSVMALGGFGGLSLGVAQGDSGHAWTVGYERNARPWTFTASHSQASDDYWQLSDAVDGGHRLTTRRLTTMGVGYGDKTWNVSAAYRHLTTSRGQDSETIQGRVRWTPNRANSVSLFASYDMKSKDIAWMLGWQHRFGSHLQATLSHRPEQTVGTLQGSNKVAGRLAQWSVSTDGDQHNVQARLDGETLSGSVSLTNDQQRLSVEGGVWLGEGGVIAGKRSYGSFALVNVPNLPHVVIQGPGQQATTNSRGYAVLPNLSSLARVTLNIDGDSLDAGTQLEADSLTVVAPRQGGVKAQYRVASDAFRTYQVMANGSPMSMVEAKGERESAMIGEGGVMVLMEPREGDTFTVTTNGATCRITLPALGRDALTPTPVICEATP